ncbi:hypothetical protein ACOTJG_03320 [Achromobacter xylosoxidans]|uniref:hypothetical protein n=1 Tax=Alcaligenes xylosoxydans xylosoxydans TaxID=85698 RepID=UPI0010418C7E|nr:hypothetical protein [Achromobacter xylosoxidans]QEQ23239.1 hypothetical protein F0U64_13005 [Achromobacter xylosoxidans]
MKLTIRLFFSSALLLLAVGCCLTSSPYMCRSSQAQAWIMYWVLPMQMYWPLNGQAEETRWMDWKECGGDKDGSFYIKDANKLTVNDERYRRESMALRDELKRCMQKKGYQFVPQCHQLEKCGPPPPKPNGGSWPTWASDVWPPESLEDRPPPRHFSPPPQGTP